MIPCFDPSIYVLDFPSLKVLDVISKLVPVGSIKVEIAPGTSGVVGLIWVYWPVRYSTDWEKVWD